MVTLARWCGVAVLLTLFAGCAEYEALPRDYQPQQTQVERQQSQQTTIASVTVLVNRALEIKVEVEHTTSDG
jgi:hypothetical protein